MSGTSRSPRITLRRSPWALPLLAVLLAGILLAVAQEASLSNPAWPGVHIWKQPNGTLVRYKLRGDEFFHYRVGMDGRPLVIQNGWLVPGSKPVYKPGPRSRGVTVRARGTKAARGVVANGTMNLPVLLANFSDTTTTFAKSDFQNLLFGPVLSMAAYYTEVSAGKATVSAGPSGLADWHTAKNTHDYYGNKGNDRAPELVIEMVQAADAAGYDFGPYDSTGNGYVDTVEIVYQGLGQDFSGNPNDIWPHSWDLSSAQAAGIGTGPVKTKSGQIVNHYTAQSEIGADGGIRTIGVFCHEYGHVLGEPDFYDVTYGSEGDGEWTIMAGGSWNGPQGNGDVPAHFDAWSKQFLGFTTPTVVSGGGIPGAKLPQVETGSFSYRINGTGKEYILLENRELVGFDRYLPGPGLVIWHIDDARATADNTDNTQPWYPGHTNFGHYRVALVQADNLWQMEQNINQGDTGDPYPGSTGNRTFDLNSAPAAKQYDGTPFPYVVRNISSPGVVVTADIVNPNAPLAPKSIQAFSTPNDETGSITVTWSKSGDDGAGLKDVTGYDLMRAPTSTGPWTKLLTLPPGSTSYHDTGVVKGSTYYYQVIVWASNGLSSMSSVAGPVTSVDNKQPNPITTLVAINTPGSTGGSITLDWTGYVAPDDFGWYTVYRSTSTFTTTAATGLTKIATITNASQQNYTDTTTVDGTTYYYAVVASNVNGYANSAVTVVSAVSNPIFAFGWPAGTSMIAIGAMPPNPDLAVIFGVKPGSLDISRYDPTINDYHRYWLVPTDSYLQQALGRAFWLTTPTTISLNVAGQPAPKGDFAVPFLSGWNMVGNPYTEDCDITAAQVVTPTGAMTLAAAATAGLVRDYMWRYDPFLRSYRLISPDISFAEKVIPRGQGVFFRGFTSASLQLPRPSGAAVPTTTTTSGVRAASAPVTPVEWKLRLTAQSDAGADVDNFVGVSSAAAKLNGVLKPPVAGVHLYFETPEGVRTAHQFTQPGTALATCKFKVYAAQGGPVTVRWPDISALPATCKPVLVDSLTGTRTYMRTSLGYTYNAAADDTRPFVIDFTAEGAGALVVKSMAARQVGSGAQVTFSLNRTATATVEVFNLAGRKVRTVTTGSLVVAGEVTTLAWDGRSSAGTQVPSGRYLVVVTAASDEGQSARSVTAVTVRR